MLVKLYLVHRQMWMHILCQSGSKGYKHSDTNVASGGPGVVRPGCPFLCHHLLTRWLPWFGLCVAWNGEPGWGGLLGVILSLGIRSCLSLFWTRSHVIQGCLREYTPDPKSWSYSYSSPSSSVKTPRRWHFCLVHHPWLSFWHKVGDKYLLNGWVKRAPHHLPVKLFCF